MMKARSIRSVVVVFAALSVGAGLLACEADTGPDAPARTNGCIDTSCSSPAPVVPLEQPKDGGSD